MNKILAALVLVAASTAASALDLGVGLSRNYEDKVDRNSYGLTVGQKFGKMGLQAGAEHLSLGANQTRWTVLGSYDVYRFDKDITLAVKGGGAFLNNEKSADGFALLGGAGINVPLKNGLSATFDYRYQWGQNRVNAFDGSTLGAGLKYSF